MTFQIVLQLCLGGFPSIDSHCNEADVLWISDFYRNSAHESPAVSFPARASRPELWCNANKMQRSVLSHSEDKFTINHDMPNIFPGLLKHYGMVSNNESHSGDWGCLTTAWLMKADAQEMRVCVFLKFACNVYVNTGFMTVRGTGARHIQINSHILQHYSFDFYHRCRKKNL